MPAYELTMILRTMSKPELASALKRTGELMLKSGVILRDIENLGTKELPIKMSRHGRTHTSGSYFLFRFDAAPVFQRTLRDEMKRDVDVIRGTLISLTQPRSITCTLEEEMQPPAYRQSVQKLLKEGRVPKRPTYEKHTDGPV
ncbi:unnamed protein product [Ixodes hexagonus]